MLSMLSIYTIVTKNVMYSVVIALLLMVAMSTIAHAKLIKIGVLAHRGISHATQTWNATAHYLSDSIPDHSFVIVALTNDNIQVAVETGEIDFVLTNPVSYAMLEYHYGISRLATLRNKRQYGEYTRFAALILTRSERDDIQSIDDLYGKSFMAIHPNAFGGWLMAWRELKQNGFEPVKDFSSLQFSGFPQDQVIYAIRDGAVDAGTVRTDVLESMVARGLVELEQFKVLNQKTTPDFPFMHSTMLYPEWPFAMCQKVEKLLARQVAVALLSLPSDHEAAIAAGIYGWTVPLDYQPVHNLMKELRVGPYSDIGDITFSDLFKQYSFWMLLGSVIVAVLVFTVVLFIALNRRVIYSKNRLETEMQGRKLAESESARMGALLDESITEIFIVDAKTLRFIQSNKGAQRNLGYTASELKSITIIDIQPEFNFNNFYKMLSPLLSNRKEKLEYTTYIKRKDGSYYKVDAWVQLSTNMDDEVYIVVFEDITAHQETQQLLHKERVQAQVTLECIGDAVITTDNLGFIEYMNPIAEKMIGYTSQKAYGQPLTSLIRLIDSETNSQLSDPVRRCIDEGEYVEQGKGIILVGADKVKTPVHATVSLRRSQEGGVDGTVLVFRDVTQLHTLQDEMQYFATHDDLTHLYNRHFLTSELDKTIIEVQNDTKLSAALLYIDMDQFKIINDTCGHTAGDQLLCEVSGYLLQSVSSSDLVARIGGDEFAVILKPDCDIESAIVISERILTSLTKYRFEYDRKIFQVSASIGIVLIDRYSGKLSEVMSKADSACYVAKDSGRNRFYVYQHDDEALIKRHGEMQWVQNIKSSLEKNNFELYLQGIFSLQNADYICKSYEVLLRMIGESGELIHPASFIPAAERYQLMSQIDHWVFDNAFTFLLNSNSSSSNLLQLSINVSGQALSDMHYTDYVTKMLAEKSQIAGCLTFEITETAAIANFRRAVHFINKVRNMGSKFALDDFGSGMSSFDYLKNLPVDYLKIDGSFVRNIAENREDFLMVKAICQVGQAMGMQTIAEYVENKAILEKLNEIGVDYGQGFELQKPFPADSFLQDAQSILSSG